LAIFSPWSVHLRAELPCAARHSDRVQVVYEHFQPAQSYLAECHGRRDGPGRDGRMLKLKLKLKHEHQHQHQHQHCQRQRL
jgi:hypothetical protein